MSDRVLFSVNDYDRDGDMTEYGIFLHFGGVRVKVADNIAELYAHIQHLQEMIPEIEENAGYLPKEQ